MEQRSCNQCKYGQWDYYKNHPLECLLKCNECIRYINFKLTRDYFEEEAKADPSEVKKLAMNKGQYYPCLNCEYWGLDKPITHCLTCVSYFNWKEEKSPTEGESRSVTKRLKIQKEDNDG